MTKQILMGIFLRPEPLKFSRLFLREGLFSILNKIEYSQIDNLLDESRMEILINDFIQLLFKNIDYIPLYLRIFFKAVFIIVEEKVNYSFYIHFLFIFYSFFFHFLFIFYSFFIHFLFIFYSFFIHFLFIFYSFFIHFLFIFYSFFIHFLFIVH